MSQEPTENSDSLRCSTAQGIIEGLDSFVHHLFEAKKRGKTLRSHTCEGCTQTVSIEFDSIPEVQTKFMQCPCGTVNRVVYRP
jgi:hypothetical protein